MRISTKPLLKTLLFSVVALLPSWLLTILGIALGAEPGHTMKPYYIGTTDEAGFKIHEFGPLYWRLVGFIDLITVLFCILVSVFRLLKTRKEKPLFRKTLKEVVVFYVSVAFQLFLKRILFLVAYYFI